jgi:hypothetical protein
MRLVRRLGNAARLGCVLAFAVLVSGMAFAQQPATPSDLDRLIAFFYRDPRPERLAGVFASEQAQSSSWMAYPPITGLLARSFNLHPDWIERLIPNAPDSKAASTLVAALRLSGHAAEAERFRARLGNGGLDAKLEGEFAALPARLEDIRIKTPSDLDVLWGASFADGDGRYVRQIIDFFADTANESEPVALDVARICVAMAGGPKDVYAGLKAKYSEAQARRLVYAATALWAIGSNARQHEYVKHTAADYIRDHQGAPATNALSVITGTK